MRDRYSSVMVMLAILGVHVSGACGAENAAGGSEGTTAWTWERYAGNPILTTHDLPAPPRGQLIALGDPSVIYDAVARKYKMWFGYGGLDSRTDLSTVRIRIGYAVSDEGRRWQTVAVPALDAGSGWDRTNAETPAILKDDNLPSGHPRKYRLYYAGLDQAVEQLPLDQLLKKGMAYGIGLAFSSDGKSFKRIPASESPYGIEGLVLKPNTPLLGQDNWDLINVSDPHAVFANGIYHLYYTSMSFTARPEQTYFAIAHATSNDGIRWTKQGHVVKPDLEWERGGPEPNVGRPSVIWNGDRFEMFYDATAKSDNPNRNTVRGVGFAWSQDGNVWNKTSAPVFTPNHSAGERLGMLIGAGALLQAETYYLYYLGADASWDLQVMNLATSRVGPIAVERPGE